MMVPVFVPPHFVGKKMPSNFARPTGGVLQGTPGKNHTPKNWTEKTPTTVFFSAFVILFVFNFLESCHTGDGQRKDFIDLRDAVRQSQRRPPHPFMEAGQRTFSGRWLHHHGVLPALSLFK